MRRQPIDYTNPAEFPGAVARQAKRRGTPATHHYVIGRWYLNADRGVVELHAVACEPGYWIDDAKPLTPIAARWYRWRSRQAAHWLLRQRRHLAGCDVINLDSLATAPLAEEPPPPSWQEARGGSALSRRQVGRVDRP